MCTLKLFKKTNEEGRKNQQFRTNSSALTSEETDRLTERFSLVYCIVVNNA